MKTTTEKLLSELNIKNGKEYPNIGYQYFADIKGDGRNIKSIWYILNEGGGVTYSNLNAATAKERCAKIRAAIEKD